MQKYLLIGVIWGPFFGSLPNLPTLPLSYWSSSQWEGRGVQKSRGHSRWLARNLLGWICLNQPLTHKAEPAGDFSARGGFSRTKRQPTSTHFWGSACCAHAKRKNPLLPAIGCTHRPQWFVCNPWSTHRGIFLQLIMAHLKEIPSNTSFFILWVKCRKHNLLEANWELLEELASFCRFARKIQLKSFKMLPQNIYFIS